MAFDLVHYFTEQIKTQQPQLLVEKSHPERCEIIHQLNCLCLGKLIQLWRQAPESVYLEISEPNSRYIYPIAQQLSSHPQIQSGLSSTTLESSLECILGLQIAELKQLNDTAHFGQAGMAELLNGQIEHLSGQAYDWVWQCNGLNELLGSKPNLAEPEISLATTLKDFHQMVQQPDSHSPQLQTDLSHDSTPEMITPTWAKMIAPIIALAVLAYLYYWYSLLSSV